MNKKSILSIGLICALSFGITACGKEKQDIGKIDTVKTEKSKSDVSDKPFQGTENNTGYKMLKMDDCYAGYSMPYPRKFTKEVYAANLIKLTEPSTNTTIYIEHSMNDTDIESSDGESGYSNIGTVKTLLAPKIAYEDFVVNNTTYKRYIDQNVEKPNSGSEVSKKDLLLSVEDYPKLNLLQGKQTTRNTNVSERRYYIQYKNVATSISMITSSDNFEKEKAVVDYMVKNISGVNESFKDTRKVEITKGFSLKLPNQFKQYTIGDKELGSGTMYQVPADSQSSLAGAFIDVFDVGKKYTIKKYESGNIYFSDSFPTEAPNMSNYDSTNGVSEETASIYTEVLKGKVKMSPARISNITIYRTGLRGSRLLEHQTAWVTEAFTVGEGRNKKLVVFGYNIARYNEMKNVFEKAL